MEGEKEKANLLLSLERGVEVELLEMATGQQQSSGVRGSVVGQTNLNKAICMRSRKSE